MFSPDGKFVAYTQTVSGSQVFDDEIDQVGAPLAQAVDLTVAPGTTADSQSDWQPGLAAQLPESRLAVLLPPAGLLTAGVVLALHRRRRERSERRG